MVKEMSDKSPNPNCELCHGTGTFIGCGVDHRGYTICLQCKCHRCYPGSFTLYPEPISENARQIDKERQLTRPETIPGWDPKLEPVIAEHKRRIYEKEAVMEANVDKRCLSAGDYIDIGNGVRDDMVREGLIKPEQRAILVEAFRRMR